MNIIMALAAINCVGPEMISSDITFVTKTATKPAWKAGPDLNVKQRYAVKAVARSMAIAKFLENADANMDGRDSTATSAFLTQDVSMALALNHGSVCVKRIGVVSSVTKI